MKKVLAVAGAVALGATATAEAGGEAGGIDRGRLTYGALFEKGNYVEFGVSHVNPKVSGTYANPAFGGNSGEMAPSYTNLSFALKRDVNDRLSYGLFVNTPYGADASYSNGLYTGLAATWESQQAAVVLKYKPQPNFSVYGGLKVVRSKATINIPDALIRGRLSQVAQTPTGSVQPAAAATAAAVAITPQQQAQAILANSPAGTLAYSASGPSDSRLGVIIGAAYEKPEIALRVGLTYESGFTHKFKTTESVASPAISAMFGTSTTHIKMPQSVTLDFQSGIAKDTLVFGSIRWSEWSVWEVKPIGYATLTGGANITDFSNNVVTYQIGIGRKLNENFSVFARAGYEKSNGGIASRLSPTDGSRSFGIGGTYTKDGVKVTAGVEYAKLGDAIDGSGTRFAGNSAVGVGVTVGYSF